MDELTKVKLTAGAAAVVSVAAIVVGVVSLKKPVPSVFLTATLQKPTPCGHTTYTVLVSQGGIAFPDPFNICNGDLVKWEKAATGQPDFKVEFSALDTDRPFPQQEYHTDNSDDVTSDPARKPSATYSYYKYNVYIKVGTNWNLVSDPGGVVWQ